MDWAGFLITLGQSLSYPAFWVGFVLVATFALNRFSVSETSSDTIDPPVVARSFTTRFRYYLSATAYIGCYEFSYGILVGIGSFPFLQGILEEWIGGLKVADSDQIIGTPTWAALIVTSAVPSAPGYRAVDQRIRDSLHSFASIPEKARALSKEIIAQLKETLTDANADDETPAEQAQQLKWLYEAVEKLENTDDNPHNALRYNRFFSRHGRELQQARRKKEKLDEALVPAGPTEPLIVDELNTLINNAARYLSCALLQVESSERNVRKTLRDTLGLTQLPKLKFDFTLKQIIIAVFTTLVFTFIGGVLSLDLVLPNSVEFKKIVLFSISWLPYSALMLVPPFIFAAGVQLYFLDLRQSHSKDISFEDKLLALMGLFIGTYGVGVLPPLAGMTIRQLMPNNGWQIESFKWIMQVLPFGLTPAFVAVLFYLLASRHLVNSRWGATALDFSIFALLAGGCTWLATHIATVNGLSFSEASKIDNFSRGDALVVLPITAAILVGVLGALQCRISRRVTPYP